MRSWIPEASAILALLAAGCPAPTREGPPAPAPEAGPTASAQPPVSDGPVETFASDAEARLAYGRAVAAHLAGRHAEAGRLALSVGARGGTGAVDAFVLAARSAEAEGDAPRASRLWARAHRAGCPSAASCTVRPPRDDVFSAAARFGRYVPWGSYDLCKGNIEERTAIVNGTWQVLASGDGFDLREVPSRVLLDHVTLPAGGDLACVSHDGRRWMAVSGRQATFGIATLDGAAPRPPVTVALPPEVSPDVRSTSLANGGRALLHALVSGKSAFAVVDPAGGAVRVATWTPLLFSNTVSFGEDGAFYGDFDLAPNRGHDRGIARWEVDQPKGTTLRKTKGDSFMGPVDAEGRIFLVSDSRLLWLDGKSGKVLADVEGPTIAGDTVGVVPPSTVVWFHEGQPISVVDAATGAKQSSTILRRPHTDPETVEEQAVRTLIHASPAPAWKVSLVSDTFFKLEAPGRPTVSLTLTADKKGALATIDDRRFEIIGEVPPIFRTSASCAPAPSKDDPHPPTWPLEVCAAGFEEPGLVRTWLASTNDTAASTPPKARP